jgi:DNA-binding NtrC family response regulator
MQRPIKLLIVDDESRFATTIASRLRLRGLDVRTAGNGVDALALAAREPFDLALIDLKMPGLDGGQVLAKLKADHLHLEAIILTGHGTLESVVELSKSGAFACLPKPVELDKLLVTLQQAYVVRLRKKFAADPAIIDRIEGIACGDNPRVILESLRQLDDGDR